MSIHNYDGMIEFRNGKHWRSRLGSFVEKRRTTGYREFKKILKVNLKASKLTRYVKALIMQPLYQKVKHLDSKEDMNPLSWMTKPLREFMSRRYRKVI
ncbi:hypothetical protein CEXT_225241 [Caerostris extrusa]|uniref:LAGLIDADG homing endonuclease n=1 Tax=Caerostris extrusa TaxID=172846 RepID=A0AAV4Y8E0_CAEEX|nr:hypothetical protein CEXT_225241 [Caerostris extrusa]